MRFIKWILLFFLLPFIGSGVQAQTSTPVAAGQCMLSDGNGGWALGTCGAGGGGVLPAVQYKIGRYNSSGLTIQGANITTDATDSNINIPGAGIAGSLQQELYGPLFSTPEAAVAAACAQSSHALYFPAGIYTLTTGAALCSGLHIRGVAGTFKGGSGIGTVFQLQSSAAIWGFKNPLSDAQVTPGAGALSDVVLDHIAIDISQDAAALGALQVKGISNSHFANVTATGNNNANPVITLDGGNFAYNFGNYDNTWVNLGLWDLDGGAINSDIGLFFTSTQTTGGANNNTFLGGAISRFGCEICGNSGNNNVFIGMDLENWKHNAVHAMVATSPSGAFGGNHFEYIRLEGTQGTGVEFDSGTVGNTLTYPQWSGAYTYTVDHNTPQGLNPCQGCLYGSNTVTADALLGTSVTTPFHNFGLGMVPSCADGWNFNCLSVAGEINAQRNFILGSAGTYHTFTTQATQAQAIAWPDLSGSPVINGKQTISFGVNGVATGSANVASFFAQWSSQYFAGVLTGGAYNGGCTGIVGTIGQTVILSGFNNGLSGATATVALTGVNTVAPGTSFTVTGAGSGATSNPTSASCTPGTASAATGTATVVALATKNAVVQCENAPTTGTNPVINEICSLSTASTAGGNWDLLGMGLVLQDAVASTPGNNQPAPKMDIISQFQNGSAINTFDHITWTPTATSGQNPTITMVESHVGSSGVNTGAYDFLGLLLNHSTPMTSTSSANSQIVTCVPESSTPASDYCGADGAWHVNTVTGGTVTVCSGTISLNTLGPIPTSGSVTVTGACSGLLTTDNVSVDFASDPSGVTGWIPAAGYLLPIMKFPTANTVNVIVSNFSGGTVTPGNITLNYHAYR